MDLNLSNSDKEMAKRTMKQYCSSWNEVRYDEIRNKPYFIGKRSEKSETEVLFPINSDQTLTFNQLKESIVDSGSSSVNLAIYSPDSTVVLYKARMGLKGLVTVQENENSSVLDDFDINEPGPSKKRKVDSPIAPINSELNETDSTTDCLQINLEPSADSECSGTDQDASSEE